MEIRFVDLKRMLPNPDAGHPTDDYYLMLAQYVDKLWAGMKVLPEVWAKDCASAWHSTLWDIFKM